MEEMNDYKIYILHVSPKLPKKQSSKLRAYLVTIFENSFEKQFLKTVFKNCSLIFCKTKICLGT